LRLVPSPPLDADAAALGELNRQFAEPLEQMQSHEQALARSFSVLRRLALTVADSPEGRTRIEESIETVRKQEQELAARWNEVRLSRERELRRARELAVNEPAWGEYADLLDRFIESTLRLLKTFRDFRLESVTTLTELDDEVDSPVFDDPEALKKYLETV
jgi:hypothetical protein